MKIGYEAKRIFHNRSGLGNYGRNLIQALALYAPENQYLLYNFKKGKVDFTLPANVKEVRPSSSGKLLANIWRQRLVSGRARKDDVEIFHGLSQELPYGLDNGKLKSVVTVHDLIFMRYPKLYKRLDRNIYKKKVMHACRVADVVVAISQQTREDLIRYLSVAPEKIMVIYQSCDPLFWEDHAVHYTDLRQEYGLPQRYALFVGTLEKRKNPVRLAQQCIKQNIPLVVVGRSTPYWEQFKAQLSAEEQALILERPVGPTAHLAGIYQMADLFAYPSVFEGFGIPVLEAMASGTPVITGNNSALKEVAGQDSKLVDVQNDDELGKALAEVWTDPQLRMRMKERNFNFAQQFSNENIARQWQSTYKQLAGK